MPPDMPHRREADRVLDLIIDRMDRAEDATSVFRTEMMRRTDGFSVLANKVEQHEEWIKSQGNPGLKKIAEIDTKISNAHLAVKSGLRGWLIGAAGMGAGGGIVGGGKAILAWAMSIGH